SEISNRFIKDPAEAVKVGQIVKVQVLNADPKTKRIALSMKALEGPAPKQRRPPAAPKPEASMDQKIAALADRWKRR
ncbi:MAG TPA: S1 RNA-binding domain-containing protein, partial [Candidatus Saccharimonadales bacterium]|nr:S1 RNA-binding domain-containing protein [Candidatus Saccharimonadales bacterium]